MPKSAPRRLRLEVYLPFTTPLAYEEAKNWVVAEFLRNFGGCSINEPIEGWYESLDGSAIRDEVTIIYSDTPLLDKRRERLVRLYGQSLKLFLAFELNQEDVLVAVWPLDHL